MAQKELPDEGPSLEMPSLGSLFKRGRKKSAAPGGGPAVGESGDTAEAAARAGGGGSRRGKQAADNAAAQGDETPSAADFERLVRGEKPEVTEEPAATEEPAVTEVTEVTEVAAEPLTESEAAAESEAVKSELAAESEPMTESATSPEPGVAPSSDAEPEIAEPAATAEVPTTPEPTVEETAVRGIPPVVEPVAETVVEPAAGAAENADPVIADEQITEVVPELPEHDLIAEEEEPALGDLDEDDPAPSPATAAAASSTSITPAAEPALDEPTLVKTVPDEDELDPDLKGDDEANPRRTLAGIQLPAVPAVAAAAITGAFVGLLAVGLTFFGLQGCEAIKGTSACGGPGIPILVVIMVLLVVIGSALLNAWKVTDPTSTSFLAVGLLAVISLLFLIEVIFSPAMIIVIPLVAVGTYCLSQWVTERFIDEE